MQNADEPVGELAQGGVEFDAAGALLLAVGPGAWGDPQREKAWAIRASMSRSLRTCRAVTTFFLPEARVIGLVPA